MGVVLSAFMGGMAGGSWLAGRPLIRRLSPVAVYSGLEAWVGGYALATPFVLRLVNLAPPAFQLALGVLALLPATVAMGTSLPVLARVLRGGNTNVATTVGWLYAVNTAGGVAGPLLTVFLLFPLVGLSRTLVITALVNLLVGGAVWRGRACWAGVESSHSAEGPARTVTEAPAAGTPVSRRLCVILAVSGATAMVYEMAWSRTLSMVYGSSVYGVSITLSTFLVGIALGSLVAAVRVRRRPATTLGAAWLLTGSAWAAFISLYVGGRLPFLFLDLYRWVDGGASGLFAAQFLLAALLMLPAAMCLGALLPVAVSVASRGVGARPAVSSLYAANLLGSATGALVGSGLLLANVGLNVSLQIGVLVALAVALVTTVDYTVLAPGRWQPGARVPLHATGVASPVSVRRGILAMDCSPRPCWLSSWSSPSTVAPPSWHSASVCITALRATPATTTVASAISWHHTSCCITATVRPRRSLFSGSTATSC